MRSYYAIYVYYYTYDITWFAYYGWIWTALEADLAVICASAPALKIFFNRYFNSSTDNRGKSSYQRGSTPQYRIATSSGNPGEISNIESRRWDSAPVPLFSIKVSTGMDITIEDRDETRSQKSDSSTRCLTALPPLSSINKSYPSHWVEGCRTMCEALRPNSPGSFRDKSGKEDMDRGTECK